MESMCGKKKNLYSYHLCIAYINVVFQILPRVRDVWRNLLVYYCILNILGGLSQEITRKFDSQQLFDKA